MNITFADLRAANIARQEEWCSDQKPDLSFRGNELAGEIGETLEVAVQVLILGILSGRASNLVKKIERERFGWIGSRATKAELAEELGDIITCCDLVAITGGINLQDAVVSKFNATSEKNGLKTRLQPDLAKPSLEEEIPYVCDACSVPGYAAASCRCDNYQSLSERDNAKRDDSNVGIGMAIAAAIIMRVWGHDVEAREIINAAGLTSEARLREIGVEDYDLDALRPILDETRGSLSGNEA